jgi:alkylhydroperoxidase/carboxymuconolactone decarboxylase family protein YurZ
MVPGAPWQFEAWPSHRQRFYVQQLASYYPQLYATWGKRLNQALTNKKLDQRSELVMVSSLDALVHWELPVIEQHVDQAFDAGSNIRELMAAMEYGPESSGHSQHDGLEAVYYVVHSRQKAGKPAPLTGAPLTEKDLIPHSDWTPVRFKYQLPHPRVHDWAREKWAPELVAIESRAAAERSKVPEHLSARMGELLFTASDTAVIRWPDPLLDHHIHEALNRGSNVQEIVEVMMVAAESVQGAADSNVAGRLVPSGMEIMHFGLTALDRVIAERDKAGYKTPREYGEGFTKKMY